VTCTNTNVIAFTTPRPRYGCVPQRVLDLVPQLRQRTMRVLVGLCGFADRNNHAWPSLATLGRRTKIDRRHVANEVGELVRRGLITRERRGKTNYYTILHEAGDTQAGVSQHPRDTEPGVRVTPAQVSATDTQAGAQTDHSFNKPDEQTDSSGADPTRVKGASSKKKSEEEAAFEEFWKVKPSRGERDNPKKPAREKFNAAVKHGADASAIIAGAKVWAYAVAKNGTDPKYVPMAKTWLHQERWNTEQQSVTGPVESQAELTAVNSDVADQFESFWASYPESENPTAKDVARQLFIAAVAKGADPNWIARGAKAYDRGVASRQTEPRYVTRAATWLKEERWKTCADRSEPRKPIGPPPDDDMTPEQYAAWAKEWNRKLADKKFARRQAEWQALQAA
jgi:Helix-turn-helix domain